MSGDNFRLDVTSDVHLDKVLELGFTRRRTAAGFRHDPVREHIREKPRLVLYWHVVHQSTPFPVPLTMRSAIAIVEAWLESADYGPEPDHDGHNGKGWRVYNEGWSQIGSDHYAFLAIEPAWIMFGK